MPVFLVLVLQFTGALSRQPSPVVAVRVGSVVTLPCENVMDGQHDCDTTTWLFSSSRTSTVELVRLGKITQNYKSGRLSVTADCSLVIKKVTDQDVGLYTCRQFISAQQGPESQVELSVIHMTEHVNNGNITLFCSVLTYEACRHTVKWMIKTGSVWEVWSVNTRSTMITQSTCSGVAFFPTSHPVYKSNYESLKCSVTDKHSGQEQRCSFSPQLACEKTSEDTKTATTKPPLENSRKAGWLWLYVVAPLVAVALLIIAVKVIRSKRNEGSKMQIKDKIDLTSNPAGTQSAAETSWDMADPEDGVSYASISYTKKTNSKAQVRSKNDNEEGDTTTYATVKASSTDPSSLYSAVK